MEAVAATVAHLATTGPREAIAAEFVLYTVAADVDAGWTAGRQIDGYSRSTEYRRRAAVLLAQLEDGSASGDTAAGQPVFAFPEATTIDGEVW